MKNLYIDFDGVIMDTITSSTIMLKDLGIDYKNKEHGEKITQFYANLDWAEFLNNTDQINDGFDCIKEIMDKRIFNVSILTHCNSLHEMASKVRFIRKYNKDITIIPVPRFISKTNMVNTQNSILIDDYAENLKQWSEAGGTSIRFSTKLSGKGFIVIDKLDQVIDLYEQGKI